MNEVTKLQPAPDQDEATLVSMIERVALAPDIPIERLEKLLDMRERVEDRAREDRAFEAKKAFFAALAEAQKEIPVVLKNQANTHTKSRYADLAAIEAQAMPVVREHGFAVSGEPVPGAPEGMQRVRLTVAHTAGHEKQFEDDFPLDSAGTGGTKNKTNIQAKGSTISYGRRYLLCAAFNIATADNDGNKPPANTITEEQFFELRDLIDQAGVDKSVVLAAAKAETLEQVPSRQFGFLCRKLRATIADRNQ